MVNRKPHIYCGVVAIDLTDEARTEHQVANGIYVNSVRADSPAFDAGIKGGDIILSVDTKSVINTVGFFNIISDYEPGSEVNIKIKRTSGTTAREMELKVTLAARGK
jgi:S1-C subfamily serine protease